MHYQTLFFTYIGASTIFAAFGGLLAVQNRKVHGLCWISGGLVVALVKVVLQGLEGRIPVLLSSMVANELYLVSFLMQMIGFRWFITKAPLVRPWVLTLLGSALLLYSVLYVAHVPYIANLINLPILAIIGYTAWSLLRYGRDLFYRPSRWAAVFLLGELAVSSYRALLTNVAYAMPWKVMNGQHDPRWIYSLMGMMFLSTCVIMCDLWFFVVELQSELMKQALTDHLTGALNRRALQIEAQREISRSARYGYPLCVLLVDVDLFKRLNDSFGHAAGDLALQSVSEALRQGLRTQDVVARSGGEEFTILLPQGNIEGARTVAERLRHRIETLQLSYEGAALHVSVSVGVAQMDPGDTNFEAAVRCADHAMYVAKERGRNRVVTWDSIGLLKPELMAIES